MCLVSGIITVTVYPLAAHNDPNLVIAIIAAVYSARHTHISVTLRVISDLLVTSYKELMGYDPVIAVDNMAT